MDPDVFLAMLTLRCICVFLLACKNGMPMANIHRKMQDARWLDSVLTEADTMLHTGAPKGGGPRGRQEAVQCCITIPCRPGIQPKWGSTVGHGPIGAGVEAGGQEHRYGH